MMLTNPFEVTVSCILVQPSPLQNMIDQIQLDNVAYFSYLISMLTNFAHEIKFNIFMAKAAFNKKRPFFSTRKLDLNFKDENIKGLHL
jgi:hypothetical protein